MRSIDGKFSTNGSRIFNIVSGEEIPEDEPLFLLRARDTLALQVLNDYAQRAHNAGCNQLHQDGIQQVMNKFSWFRQQHPERMKQPGITKHLKLEEELKGVCDHPAHSTANNQMYHPKEGSCINWRQ